MTARKPVMAGLPRTVKVLGQVFPVKAVRGLAVDLGDVERMEVLGVCDSDEQYIHLETHQGFDKARETLLHESLHAMIGLAGLRAELGPHEEDVVKRVAPILLDFLRTNPRVYTFLTGRETYR